MRDRETTQQSHAAGPTLGAQAVRRALAVLRIIAAGREDGVPLREVVQATGLARPTVHRIVQVLVEEGVVERHERTGYYAVGQQVPELALARQSRPRLVVAAEPHLGGLSRQLGDTLFLTARTGLDTLCVARRIGAYPIQVLSIEVGARRPLGASSAGIAILAALTEDEARHIVLANKARFEAYRITTSTILNQIARARHLGYGVRDIGIVAGTKSISAWIKGPTEEPLAALTLTAIKRRLNPRRESEAAEVLNRAARLIGAAIRAK